MNTLLTLSIEDHTDETKGQWTVFEDGELEELFREQIENREIAPEYAFETIRDEAYYKSKYPGLPPESYPILVEQDELNIQNKKYIEERNDLPPTVTYTPTEEMAGGMMPSITFDDVVTLSELPQEELELVD